MKAGQEDDPALEQLLGYPTFSQGTSKLGWLMTLNEVIKLFLLAINSFTHQPSDLQL